MENFSSYLPTLKILCVYSEWLKSLNFGGLIRGNLRVCYPQILSNFIFSLYLLFTLKKGMHLV